MCFLRTKMVKFLIVCLWCGEGGGGGDAPKDTRVDDGEEIVIQNDIVS